MKTVIADQTKISFEGGYLVVRIPVKTKVVPMFVSGGGVISLPRMTIRTRETFEIMRMGLCNKEIAERLGVAVRTVKYHVENVYRSLGVSNRSDFYAMFGIQQKAAPLATPETPFQWRRELKDRTRRSCSSAVM